MASLKQILLFIMCVTLICACSSANIDREITAPSTNLPESTAAPTVTLQATIPTLKPAATLTPAPTETQIPTNPIESPLQFIQLEGPLSSPKAEVSGMTWSGDTLLILPQYPEDYPSSFGTPSLFAIPKADILRFLDDPIQTPLEPARIPISNADLESQIPGYEGFEAIAIHGDRVYLSIEANDRGAMRGYIVQGYILEDGKSIELDPDSLVEIPTPVQIFNAAYETLVAVDGNSLALFEALGRVLVPEPVAFLAEGPSNGFTPVHLDNIEYRITDATDMDAEGRFWVMNIFMPIEFWFYTNSDPIADRFGVGKSHEKHNQVERLLELKYNDGRLSLSGEPPLYIELSEDGNPRNWEALARLDGRGFLALTDTYPGTILGYIPFPENWNLRR